MLSSHFSGSDLCRRYPRPDGCTMRFQGWTAGRPAPFNAFLPLSNADGKSVYWVIAGLLLLIIFSGGVIWRLGSGIADRQPRSVISLSRDQVGHIPHRYKIERPATVPVQSVAAEVSQEAAASGAPEGPSAVSVEKETELAKRDETLAAADQPVSPSPGTGKQPAEAVLRAEPISGPEQSDPKTKETRQARPDDMAPVPAVPEKAENVSPQESGPFSPPATGEAGKRFFVQVHVANVRDEPSMRSEVMFQVQKGCSVTVTDKREGWYEIKMDDGRFGWVYRALLADSPVPRKDIHPAVRAITAIQVEPPVDEAVKVLFELSAPHVPETLMMDKGSPRVVCDFVATGIAPDIGNRIDVNNGIIETIRIGLHQRPQLKVRVVLDLVPGRQYKLKEIPGYREGCFVLEIRG